MNGIYTNHDGQQLHGDGKPVLNNMPNQNPSSQAVNAAKALRSENGRRLLAREEFLTQEEMAELIDRHFDPLRTRVCPYCAGGKVLEIRVQADQKIYQPCLCDGNTPDKIARECFRAGYKRAEQDTQSAK